MPTKGLPIAVTGTTIVEPDEQRTVLTLFNEDVANIIYFSDESGKATGQMAPIFPETFISLIKKQGDEPHKAWYGRTTVASTLKVLEGYGDISEPITQPTPEPDPQEPFNPLDAPRMRRI